jgi:hypothetical protein
MIWQQFVERAKEKWGGLTNDDWRFSAGKRDQRRRCGVSPKEAKRKLADLVRIVTGPPAWSGDGQSTGRTAR